MRTNKVLLIYTGGTIGMGRNPRTGALEPLDFNHLVNALPEFEQIEASVDVHTFTAPIDSSNVSPKEWALMVRIISDHYEEYDGFVILHGTDTMAYTASALSFMLENLTKPVVLTGSQLPLGQLRTDGKENLITSIELASYYKKVVSCDNDTQQRICNEVPMVAEVCIYFNGHLLRGNRSTKSSADEFDAFKTFNYPHLCDAGVDFSFREPYLMKRDFSKSMIPHYVMDSHVLVFSLYPGIHESMVRHIFEYRELRGIVMRTFGSGNAPQEPWLLRILRNATARGVVIVNVSQCESGSVEMGRYDTGYFLQQAGVISGHDSTVEAACTKLMFLLGHHQDPNIVRTKMARNIAGEISL